MSFLAFAEVLIPGRSNTFRDFPFGEEESRKPQFAALNYVRLELPGQHILLSHGGTQQFFVEHLGDKTLLRNTIARQELQGSYC